VKAARVLIEGDYVDAYLYGGLLLVWDSKGRLVIVTTDSIAKAAARVAETSPGVARSAFVDNKLLDGDGVGSLGSVLDSPLARQNGDEPTSIPMKALDAHYFDVASDAAVLDLMATYGQLFISTDDSLLSVRFDRSEVTKPRARLNHRCLATTPRYGAVTASCADVGTWILFNEYNPQRSSAAHVDQIDPSTTVRHSWMGLTLLSYGEQNQVSPFRAVVEKHEGHKVATSVERAMILTTTVDGRYTGGDVSEIDLAAADFDLLVGRTAAVDDDLVDAMRRADFSTSFTGVVFTATRGVLHATFASNWSGYLHQSGERVEVGRVPGRVLSACDTTGGFVIETEESLFYASSDGSTVLLNREVISVRSYPRSKRHRRAITATVDGGLLLSTMLGNHPVPFRERRAFPPR
jgi:hypothetical protein